MKVTHVRNRTFTVYIGRPSIYGNPFIVGRDGDRDAVLKKYKRYAWKTKRVRDAIANLPAKANLGCHCKPKACHGDVIIAIRKRLRKRGDYVRND